MRLHVGCAMWTHRAWNGTVVAPGLPAARRLHAYAGVCTAVEANTTFYATPDRETVGSWARQTEPGFRFLVKIPRVVTHERRFAGIADDMRVFLDAVQPLGPRLHALWVQLPAAFGPLDVPALAAFLRGLPTAHRTAVEVRHPAFFTDPAETRRLESVLAGTGTEWVPFDTTTFFRDPPRTPAERETWTAKPRLPRRATALTDAPVVRYLGRDHAAATVDGWQPWLDVVVGWLQEGRSPTVFVHTPDNVDAPVLARRFHDDVRARVPGLDPLPEPEPVGPPTLF